MVQIPARCTDWFDQAANGKTHLQFHACPIGEFKWTSNCSIAKSKEEVPNKVDGEKNLSTGCLHCDCGGEGQAKTIEASKRCSAEVDDRAGNSAKLGRMTAENRCVWLHHWNEKGLGSGLAGLLVQVLGWCRAKISKCYRIINLKKINVKQYRLYL